MCTRATQYAYGIDGVILMPPLKEILSLEDDYWWHITPIGTNSRHYCNHLLIVIMLHFVLLTLGLSNDLTLVTTSKGITTLIKTINILWVEVVFFENLPK